METPSAGITGFHAHIYYEPETRESAEKLSMSITNALGPKLRYSGKLIDRPVGPHPVPMFEIDFAKERFGEVVMFLVLNHGSHDVLIHPETGDDLRDHTAHALWLGTPRALDLSRL